MNDHRVIEASVEASVAAADGQNDTLTRSYALASHTLTWQVPLICGPAAE
jgi:hypothetical protein